MSILKQHSKGHFKLYHDPAKNLHHKFAITQDRGILLRFDRYGKVGAPNEPLQVFYRAYADDRPFLTLNLDIDIDPRYANLHLPSSDIPTMCAGRRVYVDCIGQHKTTGNVEVLFTGEINFKNI